MQNCYSPSPTVLELGDCLMITEISLRQMLEVYLYATVSKLLEFVARRDSKGK